MSLANFVLSVQNLATPFVGLWCLSHSFYRSVLIQTILFRKKYRVAISNIFKKSLGKNYCGYFGYFSNSNMFETLVIGTFFCGFCRVSDHIRISYTYDRLFIGINQTRKT